MHFRWNNRKLAVKIWADRKGEVDILLGAGAFGHKRLVLSPSNVHKGPKNQYV